MASLKPVIHGRDHMPSGADPIPFLPAGAPGYFAVASAFSLKGYWSCQQTGLETAPGSGVYDDLLLNEADGASGYLDWIQGDLITGAIYDANYGSVGPGGELIRAVLLHPGAHNILATGSGARTEGSWGMNPDGTDSVGDVINTEITHAHPFTWAAWVFMEDKQWQSAAPIWSSTRAALTIVPLDTPGATFSGGLATSTGWCVRFYRYGVSVETNVISSVLPSGEWVHLAAVYDGTTMTIYCNGLVVASGAGSSGNIDMGASGAGNDFSLGYAQAEFGTWSMYLAGLLAGVTFFDEALLASGIAALYDAIVNPSAFADGKVLVVDDDGNTRWDYPLTVTVDGT